MTSFRNNETISFGETNYPFEQTVTDRVCFQSVEVDPTSEITVVVVPGTGNSAILDIEDYVIYDEKNTGFCFNYLGVTPVDCENDGYNPKEVAQQAIQYLEDYLGKHPDTQLVLSAFSFGNRVLFEILANLNEGKNELLASKIKGLIVHSPVLDADSLSSKIKGYVELEGFWGKHARRRPDLFTRLIGRNGFQIANVNLYCAQLQAMKKDPWTQKAVRRYPYFLMSYDKDGVVNNRNTRPRVLEALGEAYMECPVMADPKKEYGHDPLSRGAEISLILDNVRELVEGGDYY